MKGSKNLADLPEDLICEILLSLPVKAVLRFKCVCKDWRALIGSRSFINGHYRHESNPDCQLVARHTFLFDEKRQFSMHQDDRRHLPSEVSNYLSQTPFHHCRLLGPTNGIFCAVGSNATRVALLNPATRKFKPLPPFPLESLLEYPFFGFGIDPCSGDEDFKVVVVEQHREPQSQRYFCVYNSRSDSWSKSEVVDWMNDRARMIHADGVFFTRVGLYVHMTAYGDSIALVSHTEGSGTVHVWVMGRDGLWGKCVIIDLPDQLRQFRADIEGSKYFDVYSYKESLFSIKGEIDGNGDSLHHFFN